MGQIAGLGGDRRAPAIEKKALARFAQQILRGKKGNEEGKEGALSSRKNS